MWLRVTQKQAKYVSEKNVFFYHFNLILKFKKNFFLKTNFDTYPIMIGIPESTIINTEIKKTHARIFAP